MLCTILGYILEMVTKKFILEKICTKLCSIYILSCTITQLIYGKLRRCKKEGENSPSFYLLVEEGSFQVKSLWLGSKTADVL